MYMKILYINDKNAELFDKQVKTHKVFAKYFSPSCPACLAMEHEWDDMCKDIDEKYDTDLLLAQIDPSGMKKLEKTHTYSDVDYVPHIVILENGKKTKEYSGARTKADMIDFLIKDGYLKTKMMGGSKSKSKKHNSRIKSHRSKIGCGVSSVEYPEETDPTILINYIDNALRENKVLQGNKTYIEADTFIKCVNDGIFNNCIDNSCRKSPGFFNRCIPKNRKFNPNIPPDTKIASETAYKQLIMLELFNDRSTNDIIKSYFPELLKIQLKPLKESIKREILHMDYSNMDITNINMFTQRLQDIVMDKIKTSSNPTAIESDDNTSYQLLSNSLQNKIKKGGFNRKNKTARKKYCIGKKNGKSGCRTCCKKRRDYKKCITTCMK